MNKKNIILILEVIYILSISPFYILGKQNMNGNTIFYQWRIDKLQENSEINSILGIGSLSNNSKEKLKEWFPNNRIINRRFDLYLQAGLYEYVKAMLTMFKINVNGFVLYGNNPAYASFMINNGWNDILTTMLNYTNGIPLNPNNISPSIIKYYDYNTVFSGSYPLVFYALYYGNTGALELFLQYGVNVNTNLSGSGFSSDMPLIDALVRTLINAESSDY